MFYNERTNGDIKDVEVEKLRKTKHEKISELWCCCNIDRNKLLVFEFISNRTFNIMLYWLTTKYIIAIDVAAGVDYLHHNCLGYYSFRFLSPFLSSSASYVFLKCLGYYSFRFISSQLTYAKCSTPKVKGSYIMEITYSHKLKLMILFSQCRHSLFWPCLVEDVPTVASSPTTCIQSFTPSRTYRTPRHISRVPPVCSPSAFVLQQRSDIIGSHGNQGNKLPSRYTNNESVELKTQNDVVRFSLYKPGDIIGSIKNSQNKKTVKKSKKAKLNELRYYRLKAKQKMYSPNPEVRIRYKLGKV
jgi:hypothetical protein